MEDDKPKSAAKKAQKEIAENARPKPMEMALESATVFAEGYEQCMTLTCEQVGRMYPAAAGNLAEFADFSKGNFEAWILAGSEAAKGWDVLSAEIVDYNKKLWDEGMKRAEALIGCKSLEEVVSIQSQAAKDQFNALLAEGSKLGEMTAMAASAAVEPINQRLGKAADEFTKPVAA